MANSTRKNRWAKKRNNELICSLMRQLWSSLGNDGAPPLASATDEKRPPAERLLDVLRDSPARAARGHLHVK